ncbi:TetR/AcrR family transcriptional regulator [Cupriavidus sp. 30B13]|uniref:TetR/AcrR family transcriptional regulator n=1 Tax=Cupriavidus sp. 30B13 TaxID=3384241 RepID=UPI003CFB0A86
MLYRPAMARPKAFIEEEALDAAIAVFREHGFEGTSTEMLVRALKIGRQSLYDTFGDKWQIYLAAVRRYADAETRSHVLALRSGPGAIDGIRAMIGRVVDDAGHSCLGVNSVCEFGRSRPDLAAIHDAAARVLGAAVARRIGEAQAEGDVAAEVDPEDATRFLFASFAGIRIAARGGAAPAELDALGKLALRALQ